MDRPRPMSPPLSANRDKVRVPSSRSSISMRGVLQWVAFVIVLAIQTTFVHYQMIPATEKMNLMQTRGVSSSALKAWAPIDQVTIGSSSPPLTPTRLEELQTKANVEAELKGEMIRNATWRAAQNPYHRKDKAYQKKEYQAYFAKIQNLLVRHKEEKFVPKPEWMYDSFADLSIVGMPKAGTSQLYKMLETHPGSLPIYERKEYCVAHGYFLDYTDNTNKYVNNVTIFKLQRRLYLYHLHAYKQRQNATNRGVQLINACLQPEELEYHMVYTPMPKTSKYFMILRDPADWLYASWSYWSDRDMDYYEPIDHDWANPDLHYRSPELFHEFILSQGRIKTAGKRFASMREKTVHVGRQLIQLVGRKQVLFLKNEDLRPDKIQTSGALKSIAKFTGLKEDQFDEKVLNSRTNCNAHKGYQHTCNETSVSKNDYPITRNRPMLEATRELIYIQFHEECKVWAEEFGIVYRDCLRAIPLRQSLRTTQH